MRSRLKILVLAGGVSEERDVSLASAKAITQSLQRLGHNVAVIDSASGVSLLDQRGQYMLQEDTSSASRIALKQAGNFALSKSLDSEAYHDSDVVFLALHGGHGEDGTIQALLDLAGMKYTGSGRLASAIAMNKDITKKLMKAEGIPTPEWMLIKAFDIREIAAYSSLIRGKFNIPLIIKPNNSGSTVGLTLVKRDIELDSAIKTAAGVSNEILVEEYIKGREITAAILDDEALPLVEIIPTNELYDYQCKYTKGKSQYICPAVIPEEIARQIQNLALKAYEVIGCSGLARVDFIMSNEHQPYFLEVNTLPGMTELSLAPMAAKEAGIGFDELVERISRAALRK